MITGNYNNRILSHTQHESEFNFKNIQILNILQVDPLLLGKIEQQVDNNPHRWCMPKIFDLCF